MINKTDILPIDPSNHFTYAKDLFPAWPLFVKNLSIANTEQPISFRRTIGASNGTVELFIDIPNNGIPVDVVVFGDKYNSPELIKSIVNLKKSRKQFLELIEPRIKLFSDFVNEANIYYTPVEMSLAILNNKLIEFEIEQPVNRKPTSGDILKNCYGISPSRYPFL